MVGKNVAVRRWVTQRPLFRPYNRRSGGPTASAGREADERASSDPSPTHACNNRSRHNISKIKLLETDIFASDFLQKVIFFQ